MNRTGIGGDETGAAFALILKPTLLIPAGLMKHLSVSALIAEDFHLCIAAMEGMLGVDGVVVGVNLKVERESLHAFLIGEVR